MKNCPLPIQYYRNIDALSKECKKIQCSFFHSDLDTDYMPSGCSIYVAALLSKRNAAKTQPVDQTSNREGK